MFEQAGKAYAAIFAATPGFAAARFEAGVIGEQKRFVEDRRKVAAVIGSADGGFVGHG